MVFKKDTHNIGGSNYTVEGEWFNGVPHGLCIFESLISRGVATFTHGKQIGPLWLDLKLSG
jgi:hypothetical protein